MKKQTAHHRKLLLITFLGLFFSITFGQTREESLNVLKSAFGTYFPSKYFRANPSNELHGFTYEISDTAIQVCFFISEREKKTNKLIAIAVLPLISKIVLTEEAWPNFKGIYGTTFISNGLQTIVGPDGIPGDNDPNHNWGNDLDITVPSFFMNSLVKDSIQKAFDNIRRIDEGIKLAKDVKGTKSSLASFDVYTFNKAKVNLYDYVALNRPFKNKPTLLISFSSVYCMPCIKIIDTLLSMGITSEFNLVVVNRDQEKNLSDRDLNQKITSHTPNYNKQALYLADRNNQLQSLDKGGLPFFVWLNKNLEVATVFAGYGTATTTIRQNLLKIE